MFKINMIEAVRKQAIQTFRNSLGFEENMSKLVTLMNKLTYKDVNFDSRILEKKGENPAPVVYISIQENNDYSMGIFVLREGSKLPLHDHPMMHGFCKVIYGNVRFKNYSFVGDPILSYNKTKIMVNKEEDKVVSSEDDTMVLTPDKGNIHELSAEEGPAAFVDVLSPPYHSDLPGFGPRQCHYYKRIEGNSKQEILIKLQSPPDYWTDEVPYSGSL